MAGSIGVFLRSVARTINAAGISANEKTNKKLKKYGYEAHPLSKYERVITRVSDYPKEGDYRVRFYSHNSTAEWYLDVYKGTWIKEETTKDYMDVTIWYKKYHIKQI